MSADTPAVEATEAPAKKSKKKLIIMVVVGVLVLAAAAHFTILKPKAAAADPKPIPGKILSVPTQTLNLADGHLLQVGIGLQLSTTAKLPSITALYPKIDNLTLKVMSPYTYKQLLGTTYRDQAQRRLGKDIAALLNPTAATTTTTAKSATTQSKNTKKSKKAAKSAKSTAAAAKAKAAATPPPQVLSTFFTTFLMQ